VRRPRSWRRDGGIREEKTFLLRSTVCRAQGRGEGGGEGAGERKEVERRKRGYGGGELAGYAAEDEGRGGGRRSAGYLPCVCLGKKEIGRFLKKNRIKGRAAEGLNCKSAGNHTIVNRGLRLQMCICAQPLSCAWDTLPLGNSSASSSLL
jgi:hypothetical protein